MISRLKLVSGCAALACVALVALAATASAAGAPAWRAVAVTGPTVLPPVQSEVQSLYVDAESGTYTLTFGAATTAPLPFDASASTVESALNALSTIGGAGGSVSVVGGPGGAGAEEPYTITFGGSLGSQDVAALTTSSGGLGGGNTQSAAIATAVPGGPGTATLLLYVQNIGGAESNGTITYKVILPTGVTTSASVFALGWNCTPAGAGQTEVSCASSANVPAGETAAAITIPIVAGPGAQSGAIITQVEGGDAVTVSDELQLTVGTKPAGPGIQTFTGGAYDDEGIPDQQAGDHPYSASTAFFVNTRRSPRGEVIPSGDPKDIMVDLPPGFIGNPTAVPPCPEDITDVYYCSLDTVVGVVKPIIGSFGDNIFSQRQPVYNTEAPYGSPAKFRFNVVGADPLSAVGSLRSDEDYGLSVGSLNTPQVAQVYGVFFTFWGSPADPSHDAARCTGFDTVHNSPPRPIHCAASTAPNTAFITNAMNCAEQAATTPVTLLHVNTWQDPGNVTTDSIDIPPVQDCEELDFKDEFTFKPSDTTADGPASFVSNLTVPSEGLTDPSKLATPEAKTTVVRFPKGVTLNPSAAGGLSACSEAQMGLKGTKFSMPNPIRFNREPNTCPESSKIGTIEVKTALLEDPLHGALYLAKQGENPFGSLFAVYLVIEDPRHGVFVKLPGNTEPDPQTGQITATFENLPQLPFESLKLSFKGGSRAPFATPQICGRYLTTTVSTPWSAPESGPPFETNEQGEGFEVSTGPGGVPCAPTPQGRPFGLALRAGSESTRAGAYSPFSLRLSRPDGAQEISSFDIKTPAGFTAALKGVASCSDAQIKAAEVMTGREAQNTPPCPAASRVGTTQVGAGAGPNPYYASGGLYLAGPYRGAPLSVVAITPAVAGPFDLGDVVVRSALLVDPKTAQITAKTDPLPEFLKGVQLRIRDVRVLLDRKDWALNPTSCEPKAVEVVAHGNSGATASLSNPYEVGECDKLAFKPNLSIQMHGGTKRGKYQRLIATVTAKPGEANIARAAVTFPHSAFLAQEHIRTVCTRVQFAARACPSGSVYGHATAVTPLLDEPLTGPVYLRSSSNPLPDLVAALRGPDRMPIEVELSGRTDSKNGGIRNTFDLVPDAPVSKFTLELMGGKKSLIVNSRNLCASTQRATVLLNAQNGMVRKFRPAVKNDCRKKGNSKGRTGKTGA